ncbi:MAG: SDR family oxidoreductase, partial [Bacteroidales bacterium]|nr:SDR family oxidoreductase [Bacteroidales bacterium]
KQKILITGANGYLGAQFSQFLAKEGHKITALCYPEIPNDSVWCGLMEEVLVGSVAEQGTMEKLKERSFDSIIHLVSMDHHQSQKVSPEEAIRVNVQPSWTLLDAFSKKGLKTFIFFSTIHVYGAMPPEVIHENRPLNPGNVYALTHAMSEQVCDYYNRTSEVNCLTVRLSNSYGEPVFPENNCWWLAVNDLCRTAFFEKSIRLLSDGSPQRDFIHGSDVCRAMELILDKAPKTKGHSTYHISSAHTYTLLELAGLVKDVFMELYQENIPVCTPTEESVNDFNRFSGNPRYMIDHSALLDFGFVPKCDMKEGIRRMFIYLEKNLSNA